jgi:hypothetical protein
MREVGSAGLTDHYRERSLPALKDGEVAVNPAESRAPVPIADICVVHGDDPIGCVVTEVTGHGGIACRHACHREGPRWFRGRLLSAVVRELEREGQLVKKGPGSRIVLQRRVQSLIADHDPDTGLTRGVSRGWSAWLCGRFCRRRGDRR